MTSHYSLHSARRRTGSLTLAVAFLCTAQSASAQQHGSATIGALMTTAVDTLEWVYSAGGPSGGHSARLILGRTESEFVGLLEYRSRRRPLAHIDHPPEREVCDTSMSATLSLRDADRFFRSLDTIRVEVGVPQALVRMMTDFEQRSMLRLGLRNGPLAIRDGRSVEHAGTVYHVPTKDAPPRKQGEFWFGPEDAPALRKAQASVFAYLRLEEMRIWAQRCFGETP